MSASPAKPPILSMALVVTGNMLGAGVLALPVKTGLSGFMPSLAGIFLMWILMLSTAIILSGQKSLSESATADLPTFFQKELGTAGKWITVAANLVILYGLFVVFKLILSFYLCNWGMNSNTKGRKGHPQPL